MTVNVIVLVTEPAFVATVIFPVLPVFGTSALIARAATTLKCTGTPLSVMDVVPLKLLPKIKKFAPGLAVEGAKLAIVGRAAWSAASAEPAHNVAPAATVARPSAR